MRKRDDEVLNFTSLNMDLKVKTNLKDIVYKKEDAWANYPKGVISVLMEEGFRAGGMDILIYGNIPNGAGLSSSASLELLMAEIVNDLFNDGEIDPIKLVKVSQRALVILEEHKSIRNLCDLGAEDFEEIKYNLKDDGLKKRTEHVVYENARVYRAYDALKEGDIKQVGELLKQSHKSLKDLYEVTGEELDTIVDIADKSRYSAGSRMTGAGFGGCAISIVEKEHVKEFIEEVGAGYKEKIGYEAEFYQSDAGDGTKKISEDQLK